jgi:hypothetical protein
VWNKFLRKSRLQEKGLKLWIKWLKRQKNDHFYPKLRRIKKVMGVGYNTNVPRGTLKATKYRIINKVFFDEVFGF